MIINNNKIAFTFLILLLSWAPIKAEESDKTQSSSSDESSSVNSKTTEDNTSIMLSPAEREAIGLAGYAPKNSQNGKWRLDGIIYHSQKDWIIWLNEEMYTPLHEPADLTIVSVQPTYIEVKVKTNETSKIRRISLNQSIRL